MRFPPTLALGLTTVAFLLWYYSSQAVNDLLVWGAFAAALPRARRAWPVWKNWAGIAFIVVVLFTVLSLPLSSAPADSLRDMIRLARLPAGAFAVSVWFRPPERLFGALWHSALALTAILTADLIRLTWVLRGELLTAAHAHEPFMLNHSNVSSMLAGLCFFVFIAALALHNGSVRRGMAAAGLLLCAAYIYVMASRGPQIAFLLTAAAAGPIWIRGRRGRLAWGLGAALLVCLLWAHIERINPRFRDADELASFAGRTTVWGHTWELARQRPWRGHGFGKRVFQQVYAASDPPPSPFHYPHPHSFFLFILFQHGWPGLILQAAAWILLALRLVKSLWRQRDGPKRWLPGLAALSLLLLHLYGCVDYPDNRLALALAWLTAVALTATAPANPDRISIQASKNAEAATDRRQVYG